MISSATSPGRRTAAHLGGPPGFAWRIDRHGRHASLPRAPTPGVLVQYPVPSDRQLVASVRAYSRCVGVTPTKRGTAPSTAVLTVTTAGRCTTSSLSPNEFAEP